MDVDVTYSSSGPGSDTHWALRGVTLSVARGEFLVVMGGNGSGKSTLLRVLAGVTPVRRGRVVVADGAASVARAQGSEIGLLFQDPDSQIVASRVEDEVAFGPENQGLSPLWIERRIEEALEATGLTLWRSGRVQELSGGNRQRLALAGVLASRPACLCLDEPAAHLDPMARASWRILLEDLRRDGVAVVLASHDLEDAVTADRLVILEAGSMVAVGRPRDVVGDGSRVVSWGVRPPAAMVIHRLLVRRQLLSGPPCVRVQDLAEALAGQWSGRVSGSEGMAVERRIGTAVKVTGGPGGSAVRDVRAYGPVPPATVHPAALPHRFLPCRNAEGASPPDGLALEHVSYAYANSVPGKGRMDAVRGLTMAVGRGQLLCLVGVGGSGKTTALLLAAGLLEPTAGRVTVDGVDPWARRGHGTRISRLRHMRDAVGMVLQRAESQFFASTVREELAFGPRQRGWAPERIERALRVVSEEVGLPRVLWNRSPTSLSGGEQRRVAVASVLTASPRYVLLDEPTSGLDASGQEAIVSLLGALRGDGRGVLVVTHDLEVVAALGDGVCVLDSGRVAVEGPVTGVLSGPPAALAACGLLPHPVVQLRAELTVRAEQDVGLAPAAAALRGALSPSEAAIALARTRSRGRRRGER